MDQRVSIFLTSKYKNVLQNHDQHKVDRMRGFCLTLRIWILTGRCCGLAWPLMQTDFEPSPSFYIAPMSVTNPQKKYAQLLLSLRLYELHATVPPYGPKELVELCGYQWLKAFQAPVIEAVWKTHDKVFFLPLLSSPALLQAALIQTEFPSWWFWLTIR